MRKILAAAATLGLAGLAVVVPAGTAQAGPENCRAMYNAATPEYMYAYDGFNCYAYLGRDKDNDHDWSDSTGDFQGGDTNSASSLINKGVSGNWPDAVQVFAGPDYARGYSCLSVGEAWVDNLDRNELSDSLNANNVITSHKWVYESDCNGHWLK